MKKFFYSVLMFYILVILLSMGLHAQDILPENPDSGICILSYNSKFKKKMVRDLTDHFSAMGISVTVDTFSNYREYNASEYDAVILLCAVMAGNPRSKAVKYIKENNYSQNIVYVFTSGAGNDPFGRGLDCTKIDAITTASIKNDTEAFEEVKNWIIDEVLDVI